ncbi:hypothetical protein PM082_021647 [Marasmius tenuissimus]|nr:hypothetical protein PM082_021647 [Marasmius tenuissimus]
MLSEALDDVERDHTIAGSRRMPQPIQHPIFNFPPPSPEKPPSPPPSLSPQSAIDPVLLQQSQTMSQARPADMSKAAMIAEMNNAKERIRSLEEEVEVLKAARVTSKKREDNIEEKLAAVLARIDELEAKELQNVDEDTYEADEETEQAANTEMASKTESKSNVYKQLIRTCINEMMGIPPGTKDIPPYPEDESDWPVNSHTKEPLLRFQWDQRYNVEPNWTNIQRIERYIKEKGAYHDPAAAKAIETVVSKDCTDRIRLRFSEMAKEFKGKKKQAGKDAGRGRVENEGGDAAEGEVEIVEEAANTGRLSGSKRQTRQKAKCDVRRCKRDSLPEGHPDRNPKYDPAMVYTLMSVDEDNPDNKVSYISRRLGWHSDELQGLYDRLDAVKDPKSGTKYTPRIRGEPIEEPIKRAVKLEMRARMWMVDQTWLAKPENKQYDEPQRIAISGKLWGDKEDPEDLIKKEEDVKAVKEEKMREEKKHGQGSGEGGRARKRSRSATVSGTAQTQGAGGNTGGDEW